MAYFSTWWLHGNRVSKTRFLSLIHMNRSERKHQNIREEPRKKKKGRENRDWSWWLQTTVHDPSHDDPGARASDLGRVPGSPQAAWTPGRTRLRPGARAPRSPQVARDPGLRLVRLGCRGLGLPGSPRPESFSPSDLNL